jgi:hypothetical protein
MAALLVPADPRQPVRVIDIDAGGDQLRNLQHSLGGLIDVVTQKEVDIIINGSLVNVRASHWVLNDSQMTQEGSAGEWSVLYGDVALPVHQITKGSTAGDPSSSPTSVILSPPRKFKSQLHAIHAIGRWIERDTLSTVKCHQFRRIHDKGGRSIPPMLHAVDIRVNPSSDYDFGSRHISTPPGRLVYRQAMASTVVLRRLSTRGCVVRCRERPRAGQHDPATSPGERWSTQRWWPAHGLRELNAPAASALLSAYDLVSESPGLTELPFQSSDGHPPLQEAIREQSWLPLDRLPAYMRYLPPRRGTSGRARRAGLKRNQHCPPYSEEASVSWSRIVRQH